MGILRAKRIGDETGKSNGRCLAFSLSVETLDTAQKIAAFFLPLKPDSGHLRAGIRIAAFVSGMRAFRKNSGFVLSLAALLGLAAPAWAEQNTSFKISDDKNRGASDESLQHSTAYAMTALMDLGNLNIPSAVNNGMTAYGKYRNSETLDKMGDMAAFRASALASAGTGELTMRKTDTTFRRLDPGFLRKGKFSQISSEFEKRSGMPRDTFLKHLSDVSEQKIKRSDPQLVDKVVGRFEKFVAQIPNNDFRSKLQKGVAMVPESVRTGLISKAVAKFANTGAPGAPAPEAPDASASLMANAAPTPEAPADAVPVAAEAAPSMAEPSMLPPASSQLETREPATSSSKSASDPLGNIVQAALDTQEQDLSIFQIVSRRYRILTPGLR